MGAETIGKICCQRGIQCTFKEQKYVRLHLVLGSYSTEIPEGKEILGMKNANRKLKPCQRCDALAKDLKYSTTTKPRIVEGTRQVISEHKTMRSTTEA